MMDFLPYVTTGITILVLLLLVKSLSSMIVRTRQYNSKVIAGFGGQFKRATLPGSVARERVTTA
jgi:hypothetical protein